MKEDRCVCCGEIIPEGRMVCKRCEMSGEEITRRLTNRIAELEEKLKYQEITIRMIYADAVGETNAAREAEVTNSMLGDTRMSAVYHEKAAERKRAQERIRSVCRLRNFDLDGR